VLNDGKSVAYAYQDTLAIVDITDEGNPLPLLDSDGERRLDENGEALEWRLSGGDFENAQFFAAPLQLNGSLLAATQDGRLLTFDITSAQVENATGLTLQERGDVVTDLVQGNGAVFIGLAQQLLALDIDTLETRWSQETEHAVWAEPIIVDDVVYFVSLDHFMYAVNLETGDLLWQQDIRAAAAGTPAYHPDTNQLYVGTFESRVLAIDAESGEIINEFQTDEWVWGGPVLAEEADGTLMLYVSDLDGVVYKLDPETLTADGMGWVSQVSNGAIRTPPVVFGDYVVVGSRDQNVYWIDRETGDVEETRQLDGEILSDILFFPAGSTDELEQDMLVVSSLSNADALVAFAAESGERIWTFRRN
jgi:outer membrane protein assembly factor BamB